MSFSVRAASMNVQAAFQRCPSTYRTEILLPRQPFPSFLIVPRQHPFRSTLTLTFSRRRNGTHASTSSSSPSKKKKKNLPRHDAGGKKEDEEDIDEDAFEALFSQLEEDLKNDGISFDDDADFDDISEEDLARLERELGEALGAEDIEFDNNVLEEEAIEDEEEEEEMPVKLKNWQLRRLASALKVGRRKTSIRSLSAELCLDRAVVLKLLRDPPPSLLLTSATLPDEPTPIVSVIETSTPVETVDEKTDVDGDIAEVATTVKVPVHVKLHSWTAQKRLKKVQVETLDRVYRRTKRPTNTMISSIVQVTNLPRKRVVKWFEDKRAEDNVPDQQLPYHRSVPKNV